MALIDCKDTKAHIHLIMEFCELGDLSYFIKKRDTLSQHLTTSNMIRKYPNPAAGGLNEVVVRHFLKQLASALQFLRAKNFIHSDVKPQNLLLDPSPQYYRTVKPEHIPYAAHDRSLTPIVGLESLPVLKIADFGTGEVFCGQHPGVRGCRRASIIDPEDEIRYCVPGLVG